MTQLKTPEEIIESLAALEHDQWRTWARHLLHHAEGEPNLSERRTKRWSELINLEYEELPEEWKEFDREWARKSFEQIRLYGIQERRRALDEAANKVHTRSARDCCHETAESSIDAIRALIDREEK